MPYKWIKCSFFRKDKHKFYNVGAFEIFLLEESSSECEDKIIKVEKRKQILFWIQFTIIVLTVKK
jgi:hypothetical protein